MAALPNCGVHLAPSNEIEFSDESSESAATGGYAFLPDGWRRRATITAGTIGSADRTLEQMPGRKKRGAGTGMRYGEVCVGPQIASQRSLAYVHAEKMTPLMSGERMYGSSPKFT